MSKPSEIRCLVAPITGHQILLPGSVVAEVINYGDVQPFSNAPDWILGELEWSGWKIPVINYAVLTATSPDATLSARSRILVVKTLSMSSSINYVGIVINGLPRLRNITPDELIETGAKPAEGVFSEVTIEEQAALIPDLESLANAVEDGAYASN